MPLKKILVLLFLVLPLFVLAGSHHKNSSVLATGRWFKLAISRTGIHQITYNDLNAVGINPAAIDIDNIRLFGNGSGMLPEVNSSPRIDDLREIAIQVIDGGDGHFDASDYILFYGEGADKWNFDRLSRLFTHQRNLYSDSTYYFLNFDQGPGKRVQPVQPYSSTPANVSSRFDDYLLHELDQRNLLRSGREWYGEVFDNTKNSWEFPFYFPDIDTLAPVRIRTFVVAKSAYPSYFIISRNGEKIDSLKVDSSDPAEFTRMGRSKFKQTTIQNPKADQSVTLTYNMPTSNSIGYLNYLELNCIRNLFWVNPQMQFRDAGTVGPGNITEFVMKNATPQVKVWDVTNPSSIGVFESIVVNNMLKFKQKTDSLREFIAFDGSFFHPVRFVGEVPNQNLHAMEPTTLVIVTHPLFKIQAEQLAAFHQQHNGIGTQVVLSAEIYNEFGCGQMDPTAIRDYMKLLYDKASVENRPKYLLLFGDGSYDPKNRVPGNNNLIPTFQSIESLSATASYVTDDYFGIMADDSGQEANGNIDIGIGRFPVSNVSEAQKLVDKIIYYSSSGYPMRSDWRNTITFVADDEDNNLHLHQAEEMTAIVATKYPLFNVNKIYFDAYKLLEIPGGSRFPDANIALNDAVSKGSLIINYTGHGGETGWSFEQVLTTADIEQWQNTDKLPVFVTATCEFSRFDNPERFTAGEMVILHPNGGAIALYSTTRLAYAAQNIKLNTSFFNHLMDRDEYGDFVKMGDLIRISKNDNNNSQSLRNFVLLGDPAQSIAFSGNNVKTTLINSQQVNDPVTVEGLSTVTVNGSIEDSNGDKISSFNGVVNCKVFDKPVTNSTLGNRTHNYPENFKVQNSLLFKGDFPVTSGDFQFSFIVPKSIALQFGNGKLSYYAYSDDKDAAGFSDQIIIGGKDISINPENRGPDIAMYLDDRNFISGGKTGSAPILLADIYDTNGINIFGLGIGHEIEAVLDNDRAHSMLLNDYFTSAFNSYTRGSIAFPLSGLTAGNHTLTLRAWDMFDNSSEKTIGFYVFDQPQLTVKNVINAPNPMFDHTSFLFQPQQSYGGVLDVQVRIYSLNGKLVRTLSSSYQELSIMSSWPQLSWDGTDTNGKKLSSGIYPYKICFKGKNGAYSETSQKLVIIR
ncbi:MAG: type IX secretion system sortase PorU [Bacteroidota bacterium]